VKQSFSLHRNSRAKIAWIEESRMSMKRRQLDMTGLQELEADELKDSVREMLITMGPVERKLFVKSIECEMMRAGLNLGSYLIPLGIFGARAEDLTPTEVGHLIRFFRINVPTAMSAVLRVLSGYPRFRERKQAGRSRVL
jgi:hypothetical protein